MAKTTIRRTIDLVVRRFATGGFVGHINLLESEFDFKPFWTHSVSDPISDLEGWMEKIRDMEDKRYVQISDHAWIYSPGVEFFVRPGPISEQSKRYISLVFDQDIDLDFYQDFLYGRHGGKSLMTWRAVIQQQSLAMILEKMAKIEPRMEFWPLRIKRRQKDSPTKTDRKQWRRDQRRLNRQQLPGR